MAKKAKQFGKPSDELVMRAYTDALAAVVTVLGWELDPRKVWAGLKSVAKAEDARGHHLSAGLIDELVTALEQRVLKTAQPPH